MWLYDSELVTVAFSDDDSGLFSRISLTGLAAGTYYVKVTEYGGGVEIESYAILLTVTQEGGYGGLCEPCGESVATARVHRGGAWNESAEACRSAARENQEPTYRNSNVGFRVVRSADVDVFAPPNLTSPADGENGVGLTPELDWESVVGATNYHLRLGPSFGSLNDDICVDCSIDTDVSASSYAVPESTLESGRTYYWTVLAESRSHEGVFAIPWSFRTR